MDANDILIRPILTEKMTNLKEKYNQYAFEVARNANKVQIKQAIEERFGVTVKGVRTINVRGKKRRMGRFEGKQSGWKKAIVTLAEGDVIDFVTGVS
ncbi:MAG TPA: 50S ribosomal protein L23 [Bacteroidetes bacterium]|nr:50S ribosomal protein L23 [Bacteroidota bacterium]